MLEFRLLGPVEVLADGRPLDLGPPKRLAVLAALLFDHHVASRGTSDGW
jgi:DNA-binding SARP family transcriptional activator